MQTYEFPYLVSKNRATNGDDGMLKNCVLLLFLLFAAGLSAEPVKPSNWKYYKKIELNPQGLRGKKYGLVELDSEVFQKSTLSDLRIIETKEKEGKAFLDAIPYFVRRYELPPSQKIAKKPEKLYENAERKEGRRILYKLPELSEGETYTELDFLLPRNYEGGVSLLSGPEPESLSHLGHFALYSYKGREKKAHLKVRIPKKHSYLRVEFSSPRPAGLLRLYATKKSQKGKYKLSSQEAEFEVVQDSDENITRIYIPNPSRRAITQLELSFQESKFQRPVTVYAYQKTSKQWVSILYTGLQSHGEKVRQVLNLPSPKSSPLKIEIQNHFDPPLKLLTLSAYAERLELVFDLSRVASPKNELRLYFGNPYVRPADYEFSSLFSRQDKQEANKNLSRLRLGPLRENPEFSYSLLEPPLSVWILRILLLAGSIIVSLLAFRLFQKMGKKDG